MRIESIQIQLKMSFHPISRRPKGLRQWWQHAIEDLWFHRIGNSSVLRAPPPFRGTPLIALSRSSQGHSKDRGINLDTQMAKLIKAIAGRSSPRRRESHERSLLRTNSAPVAHLPWMIEKTESVVQDIHRTRAKWAARSPYFMRGGLPKFLQLSSWMAKGKCLGKATRNWQI